VTAAAHYRIRHYRIDDNGVIMIRYNSRLHHIGIGRRHAGTHVLALTLDTSRDYQQQPRKENNVSRHL